MIPLPIDAHLPRIREAVQRAGAVVVVAEPGAGKTTRVPPALMADGPVILLQPRRVAARSLAQRIAVEQGFTLGEEVGWHVRFERRFSARTRLLVATEGILTARLASDPLLDGVRTVILDEFHERSLHADLALALLKAAARARGDLSIVVMSATLDTAPVAAFLGGCPVIEVPGRAHTVTIDQRPGLAVADAVRECLGTGIGHVLAFLPGAREIGAAERALFDMAARDIDVLPLHGSLSAEAQDAVLRPSTRRKVILATNLAETSLTVDGVDAVVDSGLHRVMRRDAGSGLDRLETERISRDSATQRAGRAGRQRPGRALQLWDARDILRAHREPEIARVDLAGPVLEIAAWGGDPATFEWFEAPPPDAVTDALALLVSLGAISGRATTPLGEAMRGLPLHPRLARVFLAAGGGPRVAALCAILAEGRSGKDRAPEVDALATVDRIRSQGPGVQQAARQLLDVARTARATAGPRDDSDIGLRRALLAGFPDRLAQRREAGSPRVLLASGHGATLVASDTLGSTPFLLALDVAAGERGAGAEARVRLASALDEEWVRETHRTRKPRLDDAGRVRAVETVWYRSIPLREQVVPATAEEAETVLAAELARRGWAEADSALLMRMRFAGLPLDEDELRRRAVAGQKSLAEIALASVLTFDEGRDLERLAPARLSVPSGRSTPLDYREDGTVAASVKLQELFGLAETPRIGPRREPVLLLLLAPNGNPVQTTRDLKSFWERTYPEVRKDLRGRYPRHPWPEDPWTAPPTHRTTRRPK